MTAAEKNEINERLSEVAEKFGLKIKLTVGNAQKLIEANYNRIRAIETSISSKLKAIKKAA